MDASHQHQHQHQQFVLRWHCQRDTLLHNLPHLIENDLLTDVTLSVGHGGGHVRAHKLVLAMCSVYFLQLFQELIETPHPVIVLHNVSIEDIRALLSFIYRGQCVVTRQQLPQLLSLGKLLKIQGLCDMKVPDLQEQSKPDEPLPKRPSFPDNNDDEELKRKRIDPKRRDAAETCKCFLCGKYLSNQYNLRVHMETHEETFHACRSCAHVSRSRDALRKHVSYRHPDEYRTRKRKKHEPYPSPPT